MTQVLEVRFLVEVECLSPPGLRGAIQQPLFPLIQYSRCLDDRIALLHSTVIALAIFLLLSLFLDDSARQCGIHGRFRAS
jgi:hypothetical protein